MRFESLLNHGRSPCLKEGSSWFESSIRVNYYYFFTQMMELVDMLVLETNAFGVRVRSRLGDPFIPS